MSYTTPPASPLLPTTQTTRHDGWTQERQAAFLRELAATHCVKTAAKSVNMSRQSAYALRARLKGEPFDRAWQAALLCRFDVLAEAAMERALNGVEVPHYYKGEIVGSTRRYDERLTVALLAMRASLSPPRPRYASDPEASYSPDAFNALVERVQTGPETWLEERYLAYAEEGIDNEDDAVDDAADEGDAG